MNSIFTTVCAVNTTRRVIWELHVSIDSLSTDRTRTSSSSHNHTTSSSHRLINFISPIRYLHSRIHLQQLRWQNKRRRPLDGKVRCERRQEIRWGSKFDYLYGRGYYQSQSTAHFNYTMYGSYLGDRYQAHILMSTNHQKVTENGGITNDNYITSGNI